MSTELYDYYLEHGGPPLPDGYSFKVWADERREWRYWFTIIGPPSKYRKKRRAEYITDDYGGPYVYGRAIYYDVMEEDYRHGQPPPVLWFCRGIKATYAHWRAVTYEAEMRERWNAYVGTHP